MGAKSIGDAPLFDSLVHLDDERVAAASLEGIFSRAHDAGVVGILNGGTNPFALDDARLGALVAAGEHHAVDVRFAFGLHPQFIGAADCPSPVAVRDRLASLRAKWGHRVVGVGEIGLDYRRAKDDADKALQRTHFLSQLAFAREQQLPVVIHAVGAWGDLLDALDEHREAFGANGVVGVVHGFTGAAEVMRELRARGLSIGIGRAVLWDNAKRLHAALEGQDGDVGSLLLETDAPDHAPEDRAISEPDDIREVADAVARWTGCDTAAVARATSRNARRLFGIERVSNATD